MGQLWRIHIASHGDNKRSLKEWIREIAYDIAPSTKSLDMLKVIGCRHMSHHADNFSANRRVVEARLLEEKKKWKKGE